jgi:anti-anti-sigma factor
MLKPRLETREIDGILVAEFWDCLRLDSDPVNRLRNEVDARLRTPARPDLVVDLSGVDFAGSSVLGIFVGIRRAFQARKGRVVFCRVEANVREVFRASNLEALFRFADDRAEAMAILNGQAPAREPVDPDSSGSPSGGTRRGPLSGRGRPD